MSRHVLITGAGGFIGQALCRHLLDRGYHVVAASRQAPADPRCVHFAVGALDSRTDWRRALSPGGAVVNLAGRAHQTPAAAADDARLFRTLNVDAALRLADQARSAGVRHFIQASSIKVNGEGGPVSFDHDTPLAPADAYAASKADAETGLRQLAADGDMALTILRLPLVYGPAVRANFLRLVELVDSGLPLPLGGLKNRRSLLYLGNLTDFVAVCLERPQARGQTFPLSDAEDLSTPELVRLLAAALGRPARLWPVPVSVLDLAGTLLRRRQAIERLTGSLTLDCSRARRTLDWEPPFTVAEGIAATIAWYRQTRRTNGRLVLPAVAR